MLSLPPPVVDPTSPRPSRSSRDGTGHSSRQSSRSHGRRSCSSGRRSRNRQRHSSRHHSHYACQSYSQHKERNFAAATTSMVAIVLLCTALVPDWIYLKGGDCHVFNDKRGSLHHLSTSQFFYTGDFYETKSFSAKTGDVSYQFSADSYDIMVNCVTHSSVLLFKACIAFTILAISFSFIAFLLDLIGPEYKMLKVLRRNGIFNILTVIMCVTINLFTYLITSTVEKLQIATRLHTGSRIVVTFDASFYLITAAGAMSVIATACNCLRRYTLYITTSCPARSFPDYPYSDDTESLLSLSPPSPFENEMLTDTDLPPPPAYSP